MYNLKKTFMKHFNKLFALTAAFIATFFAAGNAFAQDDAGKDGNYYYDPAETPAGYYYLIGGWNENRALHVEEGKLWVTDFNQEDVSFIFYVTGQDKSKEENKGKLIKDLGNGKRLYIYAGDPTNEKAIGGPLGSNGAVPLTTNAGGGGLYGWAEVGTAGSTGDGTSGNTCAPSDYNKGKTFRFSNNEFGAGKSRDISPEGTVDRDNEPNLLYSYNNRNDWARWKLLPVSDEMVVKMKKAANEEAYVEAAKKCMNLAGILKNIKDNTGEEAGQYNLKVTNFDTTADAVTGIVDRAVYNTLNTYLEENKYADMSLEMMNGFADQFTRMIAIARSKFVSFPLDDLGNVKIVTLQWNGSGRYSGINGGGKWENPSDFGSPGGGNGRIGLVKTADGKYLIASQAMFLKITDEGKRMTAENMADATAFTVIRYAENGPLTFYTADGFYLKNSQFESDKYADVEHPTEGYHLNTFNGYQYVSAQGNATQFNGAYFNSMIYPFNVQKPETAGSHTFVMTKNGTEIKVEDVDVVPAGVPFLYVTAGNGDDSRMLIPQEDQAYTENVEGEDNLLDDGFIARVEGDALNALIPTVLSLSVKDGKIGYFLGGGFTETTPANRTFITQASAEAFGAVGGFNLNYDAEAGTLAVEPISTVYNVTYEMVYEGKVIKTETVEVTDGAEVAVPASFNAAYATIELAEGTPETVSSDLTVTVTVTAWNPPFEVSTSLENAHWYNVDIRDNHWVRTEETEPYHPIVKGDVDDDVLRTDAYQWAFMGDPANLYIYNKAFGEQTLNVDENNYAVMRDGQFSWNLYKNSDTQFAITTHENTKDCLNQNGGSGNNRNFVVWRNGNPDDGGSKFRVFEVPSIIGNAIDKFLELNEVVTDAYVNNPGRYSYELTDEDEALLDGNYDSEEGYAGKTDEEIKTLIDQFQALIDAINATYIVFEAKAVVTIQTPGAAGSIGINGSTIDKWGNNFGNPNGTQGRWCIERQADNTYTLMTRGEYITGLTAGETATHSNNAEEAIKFEIKPYNNGYTIKTVDGDVYLGNNIKGYADPQEDKFNTWDNGSIKNTCIDPDRIGKDENDLWWGAYVLPYSITVNEGIHHLYTVNKETLALEEQTIVAGGTPFIASFSTDADTDRRLRIVQDAADIVFAATPNNDDTFLAGSYMSNANPGRPEGVFALAVKDGKAGFFKDEAAKDSEAAYITAEAAAKYDAVKFLIEEEDGQLVLKAYDEDGNVVTGIAEVNAAVVSKVIYNLNGLRVEKPVKGLYIQNGKKVVIK